MNGYKRTDHERNSMAAKFEIIKDKSGEFRFHLKAPNGDIIAASQGYDTKAKRREGHRLGAGERPRRNNRRPQQVVPA